MAEPIPPWDGPESLEGRRMGEAYSRYLDRLEGLDAEALDDEEYQTYLRLLAVDSLLLREVARRRLETAQNLSGLDPVMRDAIEMWKAIVES